MSEYNPKDATEDTLALMLAEAYEGKLAYDHTEGRWYEFEHGRWVQDTTNNVLESARRLTRNHSKEIRDPAEARRLQQIRFPEAIIRAAKSDKRLAVTSDKWNRTPSLLGVPNGVVELKTGTMRPSNFADYISLETIVRPSFDEECPVWMGFLKEATGNDAALMTYLQSLCGYCLTGETKEQKLFFLFGDGGNGKSVFLNTLKDILGSYASSAAMDAFTASKNERHPTDLAMLSGSRLVTASETDRGRRWDESRIKSLTGGDPITARFMRQDFFTFLPKFKLLIAGNHMPRLGGITDALKRRLVILPFEHRPTIPDRDLPEKLRAEYPAILAWMIEGAKDWYAIGLIEPARITRASQEYFSTQDIFGGWLQDSCQIDASKTYYWTSYAELFASWKTYAAQQNHPVGSSQEFAEQLGRHGVRAARKKLARGYGGIALLVDNLKVA